MCVCFHMPYSISHIILFQKCGSMLMRLNTVLPLFTKQFSVLLGQFLVFEHLRWSKEYNFISSFWKLWFPKRTSLSHIVKQIFYLLQEIFRLPSSETSHCHQQQTNIRTYFPPISGWSALYYLLLSWIYYYLFINKLLLMIYYLLLSWIYLYFSSPKMLGVLVLSVVLLIVEPSTWRLTLSKITTQLLPVRVVKTWNAMCYGLTKLERWMTDMEWAEK